MYRTLFASIVPVFLLTATLAVANPPSVGEKAPDFALSTTEGKTLRLSEMVQKGPVVLIVLRGYPGYQCPFCNRQVQELAANSQAFADAGAQVLLVYPGPPQDLNVRATEFLADKQFPKTFEMLLDPDYHFTNLYSLRWNAARETAYPSTFIIDRDGVIVFSKIVKAHGARTKAAEILDALPKPKIPK